MRMHFSDAEGRVLHGLIEGAWDDIVIRLDASGFILFASPNADALGIDLSSLLLMPHISDFAEPEYAPLVADHVASVLAGRTSGGWIEFPLFSGEREGSAQDNCEDSDLAEVSGRHWYSLSLGLIDGDDGVPQGGLALLRTVRHPRSLDHDLNLNAANDPLTGLANRHAFCATLARSITDRGVSAAGDCMAVFAIDQMRAIFMQYGQGTADEIRWGFARYLETMTGERQELALLDDERFAVFLPGMQVRAAREWAADVLQTFAGLAGTSTRRTSELTASAGIALIEKGVDWTLRQAELGLVMARAGGGMQTGYCQPAGHMCAGSDIERAIEAVVNQAEQRRS